MVPGQSSTEQPGCHRGLSPGAVTWPHKPQTSRGSLHPAWHRPLGAQECCPSQAWRRKLSPPKVTPVPHSRAPCEAEDFRSFPGPPCSSCDMSAVTALHGGSLGGVFKLPKPAPTALCSSHGLEISPDGKSCWGKKKNQEKKKKKGWEKTHNFSPHKKNPQTRRKHKFSPQKYTREGENPALERLQPSKRQKPTRRFLARGEQTQILLLEICGCLSARYKSRAADPGPAGIIPPQAGTLKSLGYNRFRGKVSREDNSCLLSSRPC